MEEKLEKATFSAGCFWGVESSFRKINVVKDVIVGYTGGHTENPTYDDVSDGGTGHAESVEVTFNPLEVTYAELLNAFWDMHNPTTMNRQGPDVGEQYRSAIFFHSPEQENKALKSKDSLVKSGKFEDLIVTEITKATTLYKAEEHHQRYFEKQGGGTCHS